MSNIQLTHCWFHMRQSGYRRLQSMALAPLLDSDVEHVGCILGGEPVEYTFSIWVRIIYSMAYMPVDSVLEVYNSIEWPNVLDGFLSQYFESKAFALLCLQEDCSIQKPI
jgi:hypothetical protein